MFGRKRMNEEAAQNALPGGVAALPAQNALGGIAGEGYTPLGPTAHLAYPGYEAGTPPGFHYNTPEAAWIVELQRSVARLSSRVTALENQIADLKRERS